ncbi:glycosyl transferase family 1 [Rhodobacteraceae bacterium WD3A24]|nr:glycosyl transferase family 1 [Rhodobacteraceae bacterium WD3A24]
MRVLLVHQNYPGQFLHLERALEARGHDVLALTDDANTRPIRARHARYRFSDPKPRGLGATFRRHAARGVAAAETAEALRRRHGYVPDVIFGHPGWGETLFLRDVWPGARLLTYAELCYRSTGLDADFDPEFQDMGLHARMSVTSRRAHLIQALADSDAAVAPTAWQADSFPASLRHLVSVIHDGIDTDRIVPDPQARFALPGGGGELCAGDEVLTYVARNLEPYRGIHVFMRALPEVLRARPGAQVVIVGGEGVSYGRTPPEGAESWKAYMLAELGDRLDLSRVHFTGKLPYDAYRRLLQVSRVHAYLTYPFVLSWSALEAMSAGVHVVASRTGPVEEVIADGRNGTLLDFFDVEGWSRALSDTLAAPEAAAPLRRAARDTVVQGYDLRRVCLPRMVTFTETAGRG